MRRLAPLLATSLLLASRTAAGELAGVSLPDETEVSGKILALNGLGVREATLFMIDVYVAGLYVETRSSDAAAILAADRTKRLVLRFVRSVDRDKLVDAWKEGLERNAGRRRAAVTPGFDRLASAMTDLRKGDSVAFTYVPGEGTTVEIRGSEVATIEGEDFQSVFFSIWLGPVPPNAGLRDGLLGIDR